LRGESRSRLVLAEESAKYITAGGHKLAEACKKGEIVAFEAKDDAYGHSFWLAVVTDTVWAPAVRASRRWTQKL
jgi:hypothetical protein